MKGITIVLVKFIVAAVAFAIGLDLFFDATIVDVLSFAFFAAVVSYMLGDRIILPQLGNAAALMTDFLLIYMSVWIFGNVLFDSYLQIAWGSGISAVLITITEVFVHGYLTDRRAGRQLDGARDMRFGRGALAYEFAEEKDVHDLKKKED
ncbi:YndM family protein [Ectobacillus ponti]|uniref:YndM family protein n=1 Tax=Ectobacillus ponti TaxID=2961894 RepID=A0AA42BPV9_9BACI|nr:YndM family protein [Ectobacillus ponti]